MDWLVAGLLAGVGFGGVRVLGFWGVLLCVLFVGGIICLLGCGLVCCAWIQVLVTDFLAVVVDWWQFAFYLLWHWCCLLGRFCGLLDSFWVGGRIGLLSCWLGVIWILFKCYCGGRWFICLSGLVGLLVRLLGWGRVVSGACFVVVGL